MQRGRHVERPLLVSRMALCLVALLVTSSCVSPGQGSGAAEPPAAAPGGAGRIVFVSDGQLATVRPNGSARFDIPTPQVAVASTPRWSPDGQRIVFVCEPRSNPIAQEICVVDPNGSGFAQLTDTAENEFSPDWNPNGRWIAFQGDRRIEVMRADGSERRKVPGTGNSSHVSWRESPRIVYSSGSTDDGDMYTIRRDGSGKRRLTRPHDGAEELPRWAPEGEWILFQRTTGVGYFDLFTMRADGSQVRRLTRMSTRLPSRMMRSEEAVASVPQENDIYVLEPKGSAILARVKIPGLRHLQSPDWLGE